MTVAQSVSPERPRGRRLRQLDNVSVGELKSVSARKRAALEKMGLVTVLDLLTHYPRRYADRTQSAPIEALEEGDEVVVSALIDKVTVRRPRGGRAIIEVRCSDGTGELVLTFFNQSWRSRQLVVGMGVVVFGKVDVYRSRLQMTNPIVDLVGDRTGRIVPIYPQSGKAGVASTELATYLTEALERAGEFSDPLPESARRRLGLVRRTDAFHFVHAPEAQGEVAQGRRRLAFDELWRLQVALVMRKRAAAKAARGIAHVVGDTPASAPLVSSFLSSLPFVLTDAQRRVIAEIEADLALSTPMHRLLQGDVGSGKTVVALVALLSGVQGGYQGALMVPTEVLAEQHFLSARELLGELSVPDSRRLSGERPLGIGLLTSRSTTTERRKLHRQLRSGELDLLVGTHALLTEEVRFSHLGVVVIDEQHRFGVDQRAALREKGSLEGAAPNDPDLLVMTATPIPRTAAMTVYGDLDYSILDELPPSRSPVRTIWIEEEVGPDRAWERIRSEAARGHQSFVVCPLVHPGDRDFEDDAEQHPEAESPASTKNAVRRDDAGDGDGAGVASGRLFGAGSDRPPPRSAVEEHARLSSGELAELRVGLLHGQLSSREKDEIMSAFRRRELDVLVATTVVEVGVDVPAATVMVIEDADRFGIAQLHQLRGRVGRGSDRGWCYLLSAAPTADARERLTALVATTDGFELAEVDLELRGEGTVLGTHQKGRSDLKLASLRRDRDLITAARAVGEEIVDLDPNLAAHDLLADELDLFIGDTLAEYLQRS